MNFNWVPILENNLILLRPLRLGDFDALLEVAADPELWEHHPLSDAYQKTIFQTFFDQAMQNGALVIIDKTTNKMIGCSRFYDHDRERSSVVIGHTFIAKTYWGSGYNQQVKILMLEYAFQFVNKVLFYVVTANTRSAKALEKLGAVASGEITREYGNRQLQCFIYEIKLHTFKNN